MHGPRSQAPWKCYPLIISLEYSLLNTITLFCSYTYMNFFIIIARFKGKNLFFQNTFIFIMLFVASKSCEVGRRRYHHYPINLQRETKQDLQVKSQYVMELGWELGLLVLSLMFFPCKLSLSYIICWLVLKLWLMKPSDLFAMWIAARLDFLLFFSMFILAF